MIYDILIPRSKPVWKLLYKKISIKLNQEINNIPSNGLIGGIIRLWVELR